MSEEGEKPEVLPGDLITRPGLYESRSQGVVEVRHWGRDGWVAQWEDKERLYFSDGTRTGLYPMPDPYQLLHWVGPLPASEPEPETTTEQLVEIERQTGTVCSDFDADCATMPLADVQKCMRGVSGVIGEQAVTLAPVNGVCTELQRRQTTSEQSTTLDEPAWVTRFANGNADCSPFVARDIADQVREMLVYKRAMESMAKQLIHPKMTALELAELQLRGSDTL